MTTENPFEDHIDAWLTTSYQDLIEDLATALNIEAGAAEAMQAGHFTDLTADLTERLDLDAGLTAIVGPGHVATDGPAKPDRSSGASWHESSGQPWARQLTELLTSLPAPVRLTLRTRPDYQRFRDVVCLAIQVADAARNVAQSLDIARARVRDIAHVLDLVPDQARVRARVRDLARDRARALAHDLARDRDRARARVRDLAHARVRARAFAHAVVRDIAPHLALVDHLVHAEEHAHDFVRDLDDAHDLARALVYGLDSAWVQARVRVRVRALAGALVFVHGLVHDIVLDLDLAHDLVHDIARDIANTLVGSLWPGTALAARPGDLAAMRQLQDCLDDFIGADLHEASLTGVSLEGVRWSDGPKGTRWPDGWKDEIRRQSEEIEPGIFRITGRGQHDRAPSGRTG